MLETSDTKKDVLAAKGTNKLKGCAMVRMAYAKNCRK